MTRRLLGLISCGILLLVLTAIALELQRRDDIDDFVAIALAQGAVYALASWLAWRLAASRWIIAVILGFALALRILVIMAPPYLSSDVYRYVWDGRVIAAGINPYRYIPTDPSLTPLRDEQIFPRINRANYAQTIYPPAAELLFYAVTRVSESVVAMKAAMVVFEAIAIALLLALLGTSGLPGSRIIAYAWHPLPLWEFAGSGHIDAALVAFVALALWGRVGRTRWLTGLASAAGTLTKLYPAVLFPALWRRWDWKMPAIFAAAIVLTYLPFLTVGWRVFGFLTGYIGEEGFATGGGFYMLNVLRAIAPFGDPPTILYLSVAAALLVGLAAYVAFSRTVADNPIFGAALLATAFMFLLSPHYPWYFAWLLVFVCFVPPASLMWLTVASFLLYLVPVGSQLVPGRHRLIVESVLYLPFVVLAAVDLWRRRLDTGDAG